MATELGPDAFERFDETDDRLFYLYPRYTVHIDNRAIRTIGEIFAQFLPPRSHLLDLMSSWRSHIPLSLAPVGVVGLGLNADEMADNPALTSAIVDDLNRDPHLPFPDLSFDGAVLTVSVQYLIKPVAVFADVGRVLRPGAPFIVAFSNRMFPTKAIRRWQESTEPERIALVQSYFERASMFDGLKIVDRSAETRDFADPVYAVVGWRRP